MGPTLHLFLLPLLLVGGIVAIVFARRKRVGLEPHCAGCDFSLQGLPETTDRCPECGRRIHADGVAIGKRTPSRPLIVAGIALLLLALPSLLATGALLTGNRVATLMPTFVLLSQADDDPNAMRELIARNAASPLKPSDLNRATAQALAAQGNIALAWDPAWGDWIEARQAAGQLSAADWSRYLLQSVPQPPLNAQRRFRVGQKFITSIYIPAPRLGTGGVVTLSVPAMTHTFGTVAMTGRPQEGDLRQNTTSSIMLQDMLLLAGDVQPGESMMQVNVPYVLSDASGRTNVSGQWTYTRDVNIFSADAVSFERIKSPQIAKSIHSKIKPKLTRDSSYWFHIDFDAVEAPLSYRVIVRFDGVEYDTGMSFYTQGDPTGFGTSFDGPAGTVAKGDVILRPDYDGADRAEFTRLLDEELVFKDVPILRE